MSDTPKRIEQEPLYPCCQCCDEYSWNKEDLRWYKNDLWCANCFDELDEDGERMLWSDLEPFVPKRDRELADCKADRVAISQRLSDALDALFASNNQLAEALAEIERLKGVVISQITPEPVVLSSYSTTAEPAKDERDKLIEQMREALLLFVEGAIHDFHYVCQHRDNCLCLACQKARVKAALSAAERISK